MATVNTATNNYATARYIVGISGQANFNTIATAYAQAVTDGGNKTIFLLPGTYTENVTLSAGINLAAYDCDALTPNVSIVGKLTCTTATTVSISGIRLTTNSDNFLSVTGSAATIVNLKNCYLNCTNAAGINSASSGGSTINVEECSGNLGATGSFFTVSNGNLFIRKTSIDNSGGSTTASTVSAGTVSCSRTFLRTLITSSGTGTLKLIYVDCDTSSTNDICVTAGGSGPQEAHFCSFKSGTGSSISISSSMTVDTCSITSNHATAAITGAGTVTYGNLIFLGSNSVINATTQARLIIGPSVRVKTGLGIGADPAATAGLTFDGTNFLNDYVAAGTWSPVLSFGGGSTGITYSTQTGFYYRIGGVVTLRITIVLTSKGSSTGGLRVSLPITAAATGGLLTCGLELVTLTAGYTWVTANVLPSTTTTRISQYITAGGTVELADTHIANNSSIYISGSYFV